MEPTKEEIHVHCPNCSNRRLFDCVGPTEGVIKIKCPVCKMVSVIDLSRVSKDRRKKRIKAYYKSDKNYIKEI